MTQTRQITADLIVDGDVFVGPDNQTYVAIGSATAPDEDGDVMIPTTSGGIVVHPLTQLEWLDRGDR